MRRVLLIPTVVLLLLGVLCFAISTGFTSPKTAESQPHNQKPIVYCNGDDIKTLDVGMMSWNSDIRAAMGLWEGLTAYDPKTLEPIPGVAEKWEITPDGKTYTFHLRAEARWSNGDPVTAKDFLFAWKRVLTPSTGADYISLFKVIQGAEAYTSDIERQNSPAPPPIPESIAGVEIPDPHTLIVHLANPCTYFLDLCAFPPFFPLNEASMKPFLNPIDPLKGWDGEWTHPPYLITNGAYQLTEWKFKRHLFCTPNPYYWDKKNVKCDQLYIVAIPNDERAALLAYQTGTVDALSFVPQQFGDDLLDAMKQGKWQDVHFRPVFGSYYYIYNCTRPPLNDKRVRKALAMAIDRERITREVTRMGQRPLGLIVPPDSIPGYKSPPELPMDIAAAKKLLADAGFPDGRGLRPLEIVYNSDAPVHGRIAEAIAQMWQTNLGVSITFRALERSSFASARRDRIDGKPTFDIARGGWYGDYMDPTTWLDLLRTNDGNNDGAYSNPDYDKLLDAAAAEPNPAKRFELLKNAENMIVQEESPLIPLYQYSDGYVYNEKKVLGLDVNVRLLTQFKWVHRTEEGQ